MHNSLSTYSTLIRERFDNLFHLLSTLMAKKANPEQTSLQKYLKKKKSNSQQIVDIKLITEMNEKQNSDVSKYLHNLVPSVFNYFDKYFWKWKIDWYKKYIWYAWDRAFALEAKWQSWRSNIVTPLTRTFADALYNRIFDSEFVVEVYATTPSWAKEYTVKINWEDVERSPKKSVEALNEWCYITSAIDANIKKAAKDAVNMWDWFWRVDMNVADEYQNWVTDSKNNEWKASTKWYELTKCNAVAEYIPWEEIIYDAHKDFEESEFVWRRRIESDAKFKSRRSWLVSIDQKTSDYLNKEWNKRLFFDKDYSKFRHLKEFENLLKNNSFWFVETDIYGLDDENLKNKWETYEHWTKDTLTICRNGYVVYDWPNPYGDTIPFVHLWLWISTNQGVNDGICQLLLSIQILYDLVYNWYADYLKRHFNPMYMSTWAQRIEWFETGYLDREPYKIIKNMWEGKVERLDLWDDVSNWFSMLQSLYEMASQISGVTRYTWAWAWQGVERSPRAADYQVQITLEVLKPIVSSISRALDATSKIWCKLAQTKLPPKCIVSIMWEKWKEVFKKITLEDLENDFTIKYNNSSIADYTKSKKLNDIQNFMNYWQLLWNDPARNAYILDQESIIKKVAELLEIDWALLTPEEYKRVREEWSIATAQADTTAQVEAQKTQQEATQEMQAEQNWWQSMSPEQEVAEAEAQAVLESTAPTWQQSFEIPPTVVNS